MLRPLPYRIKAFSRNSISDDGNGYGLVRNALMQHCLSRHSQDPSAAPSLLRRSCLLRMTAAARFGLNIQAAIEMPRWIHGAANDTKSLHVESRFPPETLQALRQRGHMVEELSAWETGMGYAQGITFDPSAGVMQGGADPRAESLAATW